MKIGIAKATGETYPQLLKEILLMQREASATSLGNQTKQRTAPARAKENTLSQQSPTALMNQT